MRRAARLGDGWMPYLVSPGAYARSVETIRAEAEATGRDLAGFEWMLYLYCSVRERRRPRPRRRARRSSVAPTATSRARCSIASRRRARPRRSRRGCRTTSTPAPATSSSRPRPPTTRSRWSRWPPKRCCPGSPLPRRSDDGVSARRPRRRAPGLSVVEVAVGMSDLGLGLAGGVPGMILADLGADRHARRGHRTRAHRRRRHVGPGLAPRQAASSPPTTRRRDRAARATPTSPSSTDPRRWSRTRPRLPRPARGEPRRSSTPAAARAAPRREPSTTTACSSRPAPGFCTQLAGHRAGPDLRRRAGRRQPAPRSCSPPRCWPCCCRRAQTGTGGWAETSLYDGMLATLGCMIGRSERAPAEVEAYWERARPSPTSCTAAPTAS